MTAQDYVDLSAEHPELLLPWWDWLSWADKGCVFALTVEQFIAERAAHIVGNTGGEIRAYGPPFVDG